MPPNLFRTLLFIVAAFSGAWSATTACGGTLTGSVAAVPTGSDVDLTTQGPLDWVHWGTYTEFASDRKAGVAPLISDYSAFGGNANSVDSRAQRLFRVTAE